MLNLDLLERNIPIERTAEHAELRSLLGDLDEIATDVHNLSHQLHSSKLEHLGLSAALKEVCRQLAAQHHIEISLATEHLPETLPKPVSLCFYRVAQEALTNAVKHSRTSRVNVSVTRDGRILRMRIRDFGIGFDPKTRGNGLGLVAMQERLRVIGGVLRFNPVSGDGTEVEAEANIDKAHQATKVA